MTTYQLMFGVHPMAFFLMALLFEDHPDDLPKLNDAKLIKEDGKYIVELISRIGKKDHGQGQGEEKYMNHPLFIRFKDALHIVFKGHALTDDNYGRYYFRIPEQFYEDIRMIYEERKTTKTSSAFQKKVIDHYPRKHKELITLFTKGFMN